MVKIIASAPKSPRVPRVPLGICLCIFASVLASRFFEGSSVKTFVPIRFLLPIALVASRFGSMAAALSTVICAGLFAVYLFEPLHSFLIANVVSRNNLILMVLLGLILSHFLAPATTEK